MRYIEADGGFEDDVFVQESTFPRNGNALRKMREEFDAEAALWPAATRQIDVKPQPLTRAIPFDARNTLKRQTEYPEFTHLINSFVTSNGIGSAFSHIKHEMGERISTVSLIHDITALRLTTGHVFERLAHQWLRGQSERGLYLDPGSCNRIFSRLIQQQMASHIPDGVHITFSDKGITIDEIAEYKSNPEANRENTEESIRHMTGFLEDASGKSFNFFSPLTIDAHKGITSRTLAVSESARAYLVIPGNRNYEVPAGVKLVRTPFDSEFLSLMVFSVLADIENRHD